MKAVTELSTEEYGRAANTWDELREAKAGLTRDEYFEEYERRSGYAHYQFHGKVGQKLIERLGRMPTGDEIIMLADGGFSHFGATCSVSADGSFSGRVNTD